MIELGQTVKDKVTGFTGVAEARLEFLNGCLQFLVRPKISPPKKGETAEYPTGTYIDVENLVRVGKSQIKVEQRGPEPPSGGVRQHP